MSAERYREAIEYELLTQSIYKEILAKEGVNTIDVQHDISIAGRSGVKHQIDVYWEFRQAGITHRVLVECKNYTSHVTLEKARNFSSVLDDIGNCIGIMVTKTGYQSGVADFCKYRGIALKLLAKPTDADWEGKIREIHLNMRPRVPVSSKTHPIVVTLFFQPESEEQKTRLESLLEKSLPAPVPTDMRFYDESGQPVTDEMRWWVPKQLKVLEREDGGPYKEIIKLENHYAYAGVGSDIELARLAGVTIDFYVETLQSTTVIFDATATVSAILRDFETGDWEHVYRPRYCLHEI